MINVPAIQSDRLSGHFNAGSDGRMPLSPFNTIWRANCSSITAHWSTTWFHVYGTKPHRDRYLCEWARRRSPYPAPFPFGSSRGHHL